MKTMVEHPETTKELTEEELFNQEVIVELLYIEPSIFLV